MITNSISQFVDSSVISPHFNMAYTVSGNGSWSKGSYDVIFNSGDIDHDYEVVGYTMSEQGGGISFEFDIAYGVSNTIVASIPASSPSGYIDKPYKFPIPILIPANSSLSIRCSASTALSDAYPAIYIGSH